MANKKLSVELEIDSATAKNRLQRSLSSLETDANTTKAEKKIKDLSKSRIESEVEVNTTKAEKKLRDLSKRHIRQQSTTPSSKIGADESASNAANSIKKLGDAASETQISMARVSRAFIGMGLGLATSYAANHLEEGSTARTALGYAGSALQMGSMGAMVAGPWGAAAGAALGAGQQWLENVGAKTKMSKDFEKSEQLYKDAKEWNDQLRSLTEVMDPKALEDVLSTLKAREEELVSKIRENIAAGNLEKAGELQAELSQTRQRREQGEGLQRIYEKKGETREGMGATDAISRIGGGFTLGTDVNIQREMKMGIMDCAAYLKELTQKKEGSTWQ